MVQSERQGGKQGVIEKSWQQKNYIKNSWQTERQTEMLTGLETYCTERMAEIVHGVQAERSTIYCTWLTMNTVTTARKDFKYSEYNQNLSPFYRVSPRWVSLLFFDWHILRYRILWRKKGTAFIGLHRILWRVTAIIFHFFFFKHRQIYKIVRLRIYFTSNEICFFIPVRESHEMILSLGYFRLYLLGFC